MNQFYIVNISDVDGERYSIRVRANRLTLPIELGTSTSRNKAEELADALNRTLTEWALEPENSVP